MHILVTTLLVLAPFPLGLDRALAWSLWALALAVALLASRPFAPGPAVQRWGLPLVIAAGAFAFGLPLLQLAGGTCTDLPSALPCVVDPERAWLSLVFALMLFLWAVLLCGPQRPTANQLLAALAVAGTVQAAYALTLFFLDATPLFLEGVKRHVNVPTGGIPNRNHTASLLYLSIFAAIALVLRLPGDTGSGRAGRWRLLLDQRIAWRLAIVLMVLALIATRSRAGNACFLLGLVAGFAWLVYARWQDARRQPGQGGARLGFITLVLASVLLLDAALIGAFAGVDKLAERISDTSLRGEQRDEVVSTLLANPAVFSVAGHGAGSFERVFEPVKPSGLTRVWQQAHNDYLQVVVERGWLGAGLFALALALALRRVLGMQRVKGTAELQFAAVAATTALLLHAPVEYLSQVPVLWMAWLTVLAPLFHRDLPIRRRLRVRRTDRAHDGAAPAARVRTTR